ncbi:hypothetical protein FisN_12Hh095 [Fistulifera solaris]|uniref:DNA excision repair protein ERCC-6 n=1 Tax=Fistulifera solaris TaxID=1519565 RepID=A0A1Z5KQS8_FISSO|nr:hypothetical protein FisN_12Hh095 [Fistulifera solaris]|eukprot:GAX28537.1 hypothetical protein FisN_12Hh095 [Fistulifera solaris]
MVSFTTVTTLGPYLIRCSRITFKSNSKALPQNYFLIRTNSSIQSSLGVSHEMDSTPNDLTRRRSVEFSSDESDSSSQSKKPKTQEYDTDCSRSSSLSSSLSSSSSEEIKDLLQTLGIEPNVNEHDVPSEEENTRRDSVPLQRTKSSSKKHNPIELPYMLDKSRNELYFAPNHKGIQFPDFRIPRSLYQKLFAHQVEGVSWMASLYHRGGGLLGDEMGMGKTFTTLTCLGGLMNAGTICNALVVAPKSVLRSWEREASKVLLACVPIAMVQVMSADHSPLQRKRILADALAARRSKSQRPQLVITSYGMVEKCTDLFLGGAKDVWDYVVLDEGHTIKNRRTKTHACCQSICKNKTKRIMLTGTPIMNNVEELWTIFDWISAGRLLGDFSTFKYAYIKIIDAARDKNASEYIIQRGDDRSKNLQEVLRPFLLQRRKFDILRELLPTKTEIVVWSHLSEQQRELYNEFLLNKRSILRSLREGETAIVLAAITRMKMLCGHPALYEEEYEVPDLRRTIEQSAKLETMLHLVEKMTDQGHKILIFSQSTKMLNIIQRALLGKLHLSVSRIDGDTKESVRQQLVDDFNNPKSLQKVFLLSTKAGGVGITLTGADRVILFDPSWNPSEDDQAIGRAYRIGQTREVTVFRMITAGTVEEKMYERQLYKDGIRRVVLTIGDEVQRYFERSELSKMFNLAPPGECPTLEKAQAEGNDCSQSNFDFVREFRNVLGLSRHDVFYKTSDTAAIEEGHDGTKLAFSSVPTDVCNPRHILDNVMDSELAGLGMMGRMEHLMSSGHKPRDSDTFPSSSPYDRFLSTTSRDEVIEMLASVERNFARNLSYTPQAPIDRKPFATETRPHVPAVRTEPKRVETKPTVTQSSIQKPVFQFDDFALNAPRVPVSKPREIIDIGSDDDFSLSGGPVFSSTVKKEPAAIKSEAVVSGGIQLKSEDVKPATVPSSFQRGPHSSNVEDERKPAAVPSSGIDEESHRLSAEIITSNSTLSATGLEAVSTPGDEIIADYPLSHVNANENVSSNEVRTGPQHSEMINRKLEQANHYKQAGQPRRALQELCNILNHHYDKLDEKAEVSLHEQIGSLVFSENPDFLT